MKPPAMGRKELMMGEIMREPIVGVDDNGDETVTFDVNHTVADIVRWIKAASWRDDFVTLFADLPASVRVKPGERSDFAAGFFEALDRVNKYANCITGDTGKTCVWFAGNCQAFLPVEPERATLEPASSPDTSPTWEDRSDLLTDDIRADFGSEGFYERHREAQELVSNRHSKGALIGLVALLLRVPRAKPSPAAIKAAKEAQ